jgi:hypothetical protein
MLLKQSTMILNVRLGRGPVTAFQIDLAPARRKPQELAMMVMLLSLIAIGICVDVFLHVRLIVGK